MELLRMIKPDPVHGTPVVMFDNDYDWYRYQSNCGYMTPNDNSCIISPLAHKKLYHDLNNSTYNPFSMVLSKVSRMR